MYFCFLIFSLSSVENHISSKHSSASTGSMTSSLGALRGPNLRSHMQVLGSKYNWTGNLVIAADLYIPPFNASVGARRLSIQQSPARALYTHRPRNVGKSSTPTTAFVLPDTSSDDESVNENDEDIAGADTTICMDDVDFSFDINSSSVDTGVTGVENIHNSCTPKSPPPPPPPERLISNKLATEVEAEFEDDQDSQFILEYVPPAPPAKVKATTPGRVASNSTPHTKASAVSRTPQSRTPGPPPALTSDAKATTIFRRKKAALTKSYFESFNNNAFEGKLPADLSVVWNKRLLTTAGITKMKLTSRRQSLGGTADAQGAMVRTVAASIELSEKVCDDEERLKTTLLHEMCHAAAWLLDGERKPPHGPAFWKYAKQASVALPDQTVTTCHSYAVHTPYKWRCSDSNCGTEYGKHSKKGIDIIKHRCGMCKSKLQYVGMFSADGSQQPPRAPSGFSLYVKENFAIAKERRNISKNGAVASQAEIMQELSKMYREEKDQKGKPVDADIDDLMRLASEMKL